MMDTRYERNLPALTEEECHILQSKRILVVGCGGLGGYLIEYLSRIGVGGIRCVDGDVFDRSNLNRQLLCTEATLGTPKVEAAVTRIRQVNPQITAEAVCTHLDETNAAQLLAGCDAVLDALDNIPARRILADACTKANIPYIFGAISGWVAQAAICLPGDNLIKTLYPDGVQLRDKSVLCFTPALCAGIQASLCVRLLAGRPVQAGVLHYVDLLNEEYEKIQMN